MESIVCTNAVVSRVSPSLSSYPTVDVAEARLQHDSLVRLLKELGLHVLELPAVDSCADSVFIGDTAFVLNGTAVMASPSQPQRQKDIDHTRALLKKEFNITSVEVLDKNAKLNGGDILFTGREFFIGLSKWSNELGARAVAEAFPEYPCTPIKIPENGGKLEQYVSLAGPDVLCVGEGEAARNVIGRLANAASHSYFTLTVPEDSAANCLYVNGTLIHRAIEEIPLSFKVFCEKVDFSRRSICFSELTKVSSGLTSSCLLIRDSK